MKAHEEHRHFVKSTNQLSVVKRVNILCCTADSGYTMKTFIPTLLLYVTVLFLSCKSSIRESDFKIIGLTTVSDSLRTITVKGEENLIRLELPDLNNSGSELINTGDLIDSVWYVPLETNEEVVIKGVDKIELYDDKIFVLDNQQKSVLLFDANGKFVRRVGQVGRGPQEYINPINITIDTFRNQLMVYDDKQSKVMTYDLDGVFLDEQQIGFRLNDFKVLNDSSYIVNTYLRENSHFAEISNTQFVKVNRDWEVQAVGPYYDAENCSSFGHARDAFYTSNNNYLYNPTFSNYVFDYIDDILVPKYYFDLKSMNMPENVLCGISMEQFFNKYKGRSSQYAYIDKPIIETEAWLITSFRYRMMNVYFFYAKADNRFFWNAIHVTDPQGSSFVPLTPIQGSLSENVFFGFRDATILHGEIEREREKRSLSLEPVLQEIEIGDNPILIFYRLRQQTI